MPENENQNKSGVSADNGSISMGFNNSNGRIENSNISITNIINAPTRDAMLLFKNETIDTEFFEPETILIPAGMVCLGSDEGESYDKPRHEVSLAVYRISRYPVTNAQYKEYVDQKEVPVTRELGWLGRKVPDEIRDKPVMGITFMEARGYCQWLSDITQRKYELPNEAQLEKAYQGNFGCVDLVSSIYLWTRTLWGSETEERPDARYKYPWPEKDDGRNNLNAKNTIRRVVCCYHTPEGSNIPQRYCRTGQFPSESGLSESTYSFRVVMNV